MSPKLTRYTHKFLCTNNMKSHLHSIPFALAIMVCAYHLRAYVFPLLEVDDGWYSARSQSHNRISLMVSTNEARPMTWPFAQLTLGNACTKEEWLRDSSSRERRRRFPKMMFIAISASYCTFTTFFASCWRVLLIYLWMLTWTAAVVNISPSRWPFCVVTRSTHTQVEQTIIPHCVRTKITAKRSEVVLIASRQHKRRRVFSFLSISPRTAHYPQMIMQFLLFDPAKT